ncbi:MAG: Ig-like domain-containing protein [Planctomycetes bacterium]|nr:Ig-like domain-containing protein [Planctomycetota bacterium]
MITAPGNGSQVAGPTITVNYTAVGDLTGVDHVHFSLDGGPEIMDVDFDGVKVLSDVPPGDHVLTGVLVRADHVGIAGTDALPINFTVVAPDNTPPSVDVTAPADGATVAGTVELTATASDNVGVVGVQFLLDGVPVGAEDTTAPYTLSWDATTVANGQHTISARARDAAANTADATQITC